MLKNIEICKSLVICKLILIGLVQANHEITFIGINHAFGNLTEAKQHLAEYLGQLTKHNIVIDQYDGNKTVWHSENIRNRNDCPEEEIRRLFGYIVEQPGAYTRDFKMALTENFSMPQQTYISWLDKCENVGRKRSQSDSFSIPSRPESSSTSSNSGTEDATVGDEDEGSEDPAATAPVDQVSSTSSLPSLPDGGIVPPTTTTTRTITTVPETTVAPLIARTTPEPTTTTTAEPITSPATTLTGLGEPALASTTPESLFPEMNFNDTGFSLTDSMPSFSFDDLPSKTIPKSTPAYITETEASVPTEKARLLSTITTTTTTASAATATTESPAPASTASLAPASTESLETATTTLPASATTDPPSPATATDSTSSKSHYGKYVGIGLAFLITLAYLIVMRAYKRQGVYELQAN